jgi:ribosomal protein S6--L-glutamate ligase
MTQKKETKRKTTSKKKVSKDVQKLTSSLLIIGSKKSKRSTVNALLEEAHAKFDTVTFVTIDKVQIQTSDQGVGLFHNGKNLLAFDAIYPRFSSNDFLLGEAVMKAIESSDAYCPVSLKAYQVTNHKYYTAQELGNVGVPGILTTLCISPKYSKLTVTETGFPLVMKVISGFAGKGVVLVRDSSQLNSILDAIHLFEEFICTQQFVKSKQPGTDVRCYAIGNYVLAVKRTSAKGDWRSNVSRGGSANLVNPTPEMIDATILTAKTLGADICAVDMMDKQGKWVVIEANFQPGPFMKYLGNTVVHEWIKFIKKKAMAKKRKLLKKIEKENEKQENK